MKKYSNYFWKTQVWAIVFTALTVWCIVMDAPTTSAIMFAVAFLGWYAGVMAPEEEKYKQTYYSQEDVRQAVMNACDNMEKGMNWNESCWNAYNSVLKVKQPWLISDDGLKLPEELYEGDYVDEVSPHLEQ